MIGQDLQRAEIAAIMASEEYFTCEKLRCRMPKATCAARQRHGVTEGDGERRPPLNCRDCAQGLAIIEELTAKKSNEKEKEQMGAKTGICENCKRANITLPAHGLCWVCYSSARGLDGDEREKALKDAAERIARAGDGFGWGGKRERKTSSKQGPPPAWPKKTVAESTPRGESPISASSPAVITADHVKKAFHAEFPYNILPEEAYEEKRLHDLAVYLYAGIESEFHRTHIKDLISFCDELSRRLQRWEAHHAISR